MRDPRLNPKPGDVLLEKDEEFPLIVGGNTTDLEIWWGCGDSRYWWCSIDEWRTRHAESRVLYTMPGEPGDED